MGNDTNLANEADLLAAVQRGDEDAFAVLITHYYPLLFRVAYRWCAHKADAEDVAQEAAIKMGESIATYRGESALSSWVYRIVVNLAKDKMRRQRREVGLTEAFTLPDTGPGLEQHLAAAQLWHYVRSLPEAQCDAMLLVHAEGLSHAEAAKVLQCAESTVSWYIHEAKKTLTGLYARDE
jgi:RNA polymerase sigma-70 factor (ECF subfamily)